MKKIIFITTLCVVFGLAIGGYIYADKTIVDIKNIHGGIMLSYDNYKERLDGSDLAVVAELAEEPVNVLTPYDGFPDGHHLSKIKIIEVIKGEVDLKGKVIEIREPYFTLEKGVVPGKNEIYYGDYTKMKMGNKYLLFLGWELEWYGIASAHEGKFSLDGNDEEEQKMYQINEDFNNLKNDIFSNPEIEKLKKQFSSF